jgi:hypothetical protein
MSGIGPALVSLAAVLPVPLWALLLWGYLVACWVILASLGYGLIGRSDLLLTNQ